MYSAKELQGLTAEELEKELATAMKDMFEAVTMVRIGQSKTHHKIPQHRKYVARIKTVAHTKHLTSDI